MQTKAKSNSIITHAILDGKIEFTVKDAGKIIFDPLKMSVQNQSRAMYHGCIQRISDGGALSRNPETGLAASPADKLARMQRIAEHLMSGSTEWALKAVAGEGVNAGLVIQAMIQLTKARDVDHANELIDKLALKREIKRDEAVKLLAGATDIKVKMAEIRAAQAAVKVSAGDLLDGLDGLDVDEEGEESTDDEAPF